jgi:hypothetical protein
MEDDAVSGVDDSVSIFSFDQPKWRASYASYGFVIRESRKNEENCEKITKNDKK